MPVSPRYSWLAFGPACERSGFENALDPWACNLVLMTSSGQVTIPLATPANAPAKLFTLPVESCVLHTASFGKGVCCLRTRLVPAATAVVVGGPWSWLSPPPRDILCIDPLSLSSGIKSSAL